MRVRIINTTDFTVNIDLNGEHAIEDIILIGPKKTVFSDIKSESQFKRLSVSTKGKLLFRKVI